MAKQVADRKRKIKEEKVMKQKAIEERKRKLEVLWNLCETFRHLFSRNSSV